MKTIESLLLCGLLHAGGSTLAQNAPESAQAKPQTHGFKVEEAKARYLKEAKARHLAAVDKNQNGKIDASEHRDFVRALSKERLAAQKEELEAARHDPAKRAELQRRHSREAAAIRQFDKNGNGRMDPEDFQILNRKPGAGSGNTNTP